MAFYANSCIGCFHCIDVCPLNAAVKNRDRRIDHARCDNCGICTKECPAGSLVLIGKEWRSGELTDEIIKDFDFFKNSNGGITLSGGEPLLQADFLKEFLPGIKTRGIHVTLETCGFAKWEKLQDLISLVDLIYFDLKHMDNKQHKLFTGHDNSLILENFIRLSGKFPLVRARMPLIPGVNHDEKNLADTCGFLLRNGHDTIHCLPFHAMGESKLNAIDTFMKPMGKTPLSQEHLTGIKEFFIKEGVNAVIYE